MVLKAISSLGKISFQGKVNLPRFSDTKRDDTDNAPPKHSISKEYSKTQKQMEIARERGESIEAILAN